jgi:lipopolysaccharide export system permease protein
MRIIQRYTVVSFIGPFVLSTFFFVIFLLTFQLFSLIKILLNKDVELLGALNLFGYICLSFLPLALPISTLFATMFTLNKLSEDSEILAMRSFGLSKGKLFLPFLAMGILIASTLYSLNLNYIPYAKTMFKNSIIGITSKGVLRDIKPGQFYSEIPKATIYAEKVSKKGTYLEDVFIHLNLNNGNNEKTILAKRGLLKKIKTKENELPALRLLLYEGNISKINKQTGSIEKILFKEYEFPIMSGDFKVGFVTRVGMRTGGELYALKKELDGIVKKYQEEKKTEGSDYLNIKTRLKNVEIEFWQRINNSLQCIVFVVLGFCLSFGHIRFRKRSFSGPLFLSIIGYYGIFFFLLSLVRKGTFDPMVAILSPSFLVLFLSLIWMRRLDWDS